jgi:MinD-like ATPase involved in chromosome partitioning or flagellar assembly
VLSGTRRAVEVLSPAAEEGLRFIAGCDAGAAAPLNADAADRFAAELAALTRQVDLVLIDAGHGMNAWIDRLWQLSCDVLLVSPPNPQGLLDAYAAAKLAQYHRHDGKLRLLINRVDYESEASPLADRFTQTCQRFLNIKPKPATTLPNYADPQQSPQRQQGRDSYQRALRLLAADLTAELRVVALRLIRPTLPRQAARSLSP